MTDASGATATLASTTATSTPWSNALSSGASRCTPPLSTRSFVPPQFVQNVGFISMSAGVSWSQSGRPCASQRVSEWHEAHRSNRTPPRRFSTKTAMASRARQPRIASTKATDSKREIGGSARRSTTSTRGQPSRSVAADGANTAGICCVFTMAAIVGAGDTTHADAPHCFAR